MLGDLLGRRVDGLLLVLGKLRTLQFIFVIKRTDRDFMSGLWILSLRLSRRLDG